MSSFGFAQRSEGLDAMGNTFPRWNGAPRQEYPIIVREEETGQPIFKRARWGFIPRNNKDNTGGPQPINARSETIASNYMFRWSYRNQRALMPIDGFFEWKDIHGTGKNKKPYAIAMKSGGPFALAAVWDSWRDPLNSGIELRTFAVVTCEPNIMMSRIHDRMPVILHEKDYKRWLSDEEDPADLMKPFDSELMTMWPIGSKVGSPKYNEPDILDLDETMPEPPAPPKPPAPKKPKKEPPGEPPQGSLF